MVTGGEWRISEQLLFTSYLRLVTASEAGLLLLAPETRSESANGLREIFVFRAKGLRCFRDDVATILTEIQHRPHLAGRSFGKIEEVREVLLGSSFEPLGYVVHHRGGRTLDLIAERVILAVTHCVIDLIRQSP